MDPLPQRRPLAPTLAIDLPRLLRSRWMWHAATLVLTYVFWWSGLVVAVLLAEAKTARQPPRPGA